MSTRHRRKSLIKNKIIQVILFQDCVKTKALYSVLAVRQIGKAEAVDIIEKVFPKCYADLEPIGRRIRRNSEDMTRVLRDAPYYGYD